LYLANKPPFIKIDETNFLSTSKAEVLLGEFKRRLRKAKVAVLNHSNQIDNSYEKIQPYLK
jgi:hypothetical protein